MGALVEALAAARIGNTFNQYRRSSVRRERLAAYLEAREHASIVLVGEAAGYRGARVSGIPFTSERQLTGRGQRDDRPPCPRRTGHRGRRVALERRSDTST